MRLKSVLYKKEQTDICNKIMNILDLDDMNSITLYELDTSKEKQQAIMALIPDIRKYFKTACIMGAKEPEKIKRPWLSIMKHTTKLHYTLLHSDFRIMVDGSKQRTKRYVFLKHT
tara:strand:- start:1917 stop:2261 length:345 start_codon:yes stop_codon:yes gene_type:complete